MSHVACRAAVTAGPPYSEHYVWKGTAHLTANAETANAAVSIDCAAAARYRACMLHRFLCSMDGRAASSRTCCVSGSSGVAHRSRSCRRQCRQNHSADVIAGCTAWHAWHVHSECDEQCGSGGCRASHCDDVVVAHVHVLTATAVPLHFTALHCTASLDVVVRCWRGYHADREDMPYGIPCRRGIPSRPSGSDANNSGGALNCSERRRGTSASSTTRPHTSRTCSSASRPSATSATAARCGRHVLLLYTVE
jgi:hypothetical protein